MRSRHPQVRWVAVSDDVMALLAVSSLPFPMVHLALPRLPAAVLLRAEGTYAVTLAVSPTLAVAPDQGIFVPPPVSANRQQVFVYLAMAAALVPGPWLAATLHGLRAHHKRLAVRTEAPARANESLEPFVRNASQDLREPLNTITGSGGLQQQDSAQPLPPANRQHLALMLHGGRIDAAPRPGGGSCFTVRLPRGDRECESPSHAPAHPRQAARLVVANARHGSGYGCASRPDSGRLAGPLGHAGWALAL